MAGLEGKEKGKRVREHSGFRVDVYAMGIVAAGWAAFWAWFMYVSDLPHGLFLMDASDYLTVSFLIVLTVLVARIVCAAASAWADRWLLRRGAVWGSAGAMVAGVALIALSTFVPPQAEFLRWAGAVAVGVGAAWMSTVWAGLLRALENGEIVIAVSVGFFIAALAKLALTVIPWVGDVAGTLVLPAVSAALAVKTTALMPTLPESPGRRGGSSSREGAPRRASAGTFSRRYTIMLGLGIVCYGVTGSIVRSLAADGSAASTVSALVVANSHLLGILCCAFATCCIAVSSLARRSTKLLPTLNRIILAVMALGVLVPGVFPGIPFFVSAFILGLALGCFEILLLAYASIVSKVDGVSPFRTLGLAYGGMEAGSVLGTVFAFFFDQDILSGSLQWSSVALVLLFLFTVAAMAVFLPFDKKARLLSASEEGSEGEGDAAVATQAIASRSGGEGAGAPAMGEAGTVSPGALDGSVSPAASSADDSHVLEAALRERYGLTERECQVALLLSEGRDLSYIQQELVISRGTVQTHSYHIYQKLGIHSKQELIDLARKLAVEQAVS